MLKRKSPPLAATPPRPQERLAVRASRPRYEPCISMYDGGGKD